MFCKSRYWVALLILFGENSLAVESFAKNAILLVWVVISQPFSVNEGMTGEEYILLSIGEVWFSMKKKLLSYQFLKILGQ